MDHLPSISRDGLACDAAVGSRLAAEAGEREIKARRRRTPVPVEPYGTVGDYVPFYFAARSPMLYRIHKGGVPNFDGHSHDLVYVCTTVDRLTEHGAALVFTDRNATLRFTEFRSTSDDWREEGFIDWPLMEERFWANPAHPDWKERRMAECLAHQAIPWEAVVAIGAYDASRAARVEAAIADRGHRPRVHVRPTWYF